MDEETLTEKVITNPRTAFNIRFAESMILARTSSIAVVIAFMAAILGGGALILGLNPEPAQVASAAEASSSCAANQYANSESLAGVLGCAQVGIGQVTGDIVNSITVGANKLVGALTFSATSPITVVNAGNTVTWACGACITSAVTAITQGAHTFINSIALVNSTSIGWDFNNAANSIKAIWSWGGGSCSVSQFVTTVSSTQFVCKQPALTDLSDFNVPVRNTAQRSISTAQGTIVQSKGAQATSGTFNQVTFTNSVVSQNLLIACMGSSSAISLSTVTDTFSDFFTQIGAGSSNTAKVQCFYAGAVSGGTDVIGFGTSGACVNCGFTIYELNNAMGLDILSSACSTCTGTTDATASLTFLQKPIFISCIASTTTMGTFTHGVNFVTLATGNADVNCQTSTSGVTSPTTFPASTANSVTFAYFGIAIQATSSTTLTVNLQANTNYVFEAKIYEQVASGGTINFAIHTTPTTPSTTQGVQMVCAGLFGVTTANSNCLLSAGSVPTQDIAIFTAAQSQSGFVIISGSILVASTQSTLQIDFANIAQTGTVNVNQGSFIVVQKSN
jgi:hypothetical protein